MQRTVYYQGTFNSPHTILATSFAVCTVEDLLRHPSLIPISLTQMEYDFV